MPADSYKEVTLSYNGKNLYKEIYTDSSVTVGDKTYPVVILPNGTAWTTCNLDFTWPGLTVGNAATSSTPRASYANNNQTTYGWNGKKYGLYYNLAALKYIEDNHLLPEGWRIANYDDFIYLNQNYTVSQVKSTEDWSTPGTNETGLNFKPNGQAYAGEFRYVGSSLYLFSSIIFQYNTEQRRYMVLGDSWQTTNFTYSTNYQMPVRLIRTVNIDTNKLCKHKHYINVPEIVIDFSNPNFVPNRSNIQLDGNPTTRQYDSNWTRISTNPNRWKLSTHQCYDVFRSGTWGLVGLFSKEMGSSNEGVLNNSNLYGTCKIVSLSNLDNVESLDRFATNSDGITEIPTVSAGNYLINVNSMFSGCTEVVSGALACYNSLKDNPNITNHSGTFKDCGKNTTTGLAELQQIPSSWGGLQIPPSTLMSTSRKSSSGSAYTCWLINSNAPTWTNVKNGLYLFTEASVSQYAGVSMNRSRIYNKVNSLGTAQASYALYFYPAFIQTSNNNIPGGSSTANATLTWCVTTNSPNDSLAVGQGNRDMSATLAYETYGAFAREYGTYDSSNNVYFTFLVTNVPIDQWGGFTDGYGMLYSQYFNADAKLRWFFEGD